MNLLAFMTKQGYISEEDSIGLAQKILKDKQSELEVIQNQLNISYLDIAGIISNRAQLPLLHLSRIASHKLPPTMVDTLFLRSYDAFALARHNERLVIAMSNPLDKAVIKKIQERLRLQLEIVVVPHDALIEQLRLEEEKEQQAQNQNTAEQLKQKVNTQIQKAAIQILYEEGAQNAANALKRSQADIDDTPVVRFLQKTLQKALDTGASDLHFEPFEHNYRIRFRIDGVLHEVSTPPIDIKEKIVTRIKVLSKLDIAEKRIPQDGRMKMLLNIKPADKAFVANSTNSTNSINEGNSKNSLSESTPTFNLLDKNLLQTQNLNASPQNFSNLQQSAQNSSMQSLHAQMSSNYQANLGAANSNEREKAQDKKEIDFRVSTLPTLFGEKIVIRILENSNQKLNIDQLGYEPEQKKIIMDAISKPYGMVLVTGPTGSGKTVSLYTFLSLLNDGSRNISSAEDPAEIQVNGINQVNVNEKAGLTFATALRSFLRQDPDIIMVGEIRDLETADISIKAAQTGHLVFSTLHTNDAPSTLVRLMNMGVQNFNIASSVHLISAQRLVRKLCPHCKTPMQHDKTALQDVGFSDEQIEKMDATPIYHATGCEHCNHTGYKGRVGIYQLMPISDAMREIILHHGTAVDLQNQMKIEKIISLRQAGLLKVLAGLTSLEEVMANTNDC